MAVRESEIASSDRFLRSGQVIVVAGNRLKPHLMSEDFRDLSLVQHVARVMFAFAITAMVAPGTYFGIRWVLRHRLDEKERPSRGRAKA